MGWAATVLGVFGGGALFLSGSSKDFMLAHPLWGWAGLLALLIAYRPIVRWNLRTIENRQSKIWGQKITELSTHWGGKEDELVARYAEKEAELSGRWDAREVEAAAHWKAREAELSRSDRERDLPLLNERLSGWELNGDFHKFLTHDVMHNMLPSFFVRGLEDRIEQWRRDPREFADPEIAKAFGSCKAALDAYEYKISEYMWENDKADFLQVPPEWKDKDHERYKRAFQELEQQRNAFSKSLTEIYKIQHSKVTSLSQDPK